MDARNLRQPFFIAQDAPSDRVTLKVSPVVLPEDDPMELDIVPPEEEEEEEVVAPVKKSNTRTGKKKWRPANSMSDGGDVINVVLPAKKSRVVVLPAIMKMYTRLKKVVDLFDVVDRMNYENKKLPKTINLTYGELTPGGFQTILDELIKLGLTSQSSFYDIGSGFGKPVFHTYMATGARSSGIEYGPSRYEQSVAFLRANAGLIAPNLPLEEIPITFNQGDVTVLKSIDYDFVYFYNPLDTPELTDAISAILQRSKFQVYATFQPPRRLPQHWELITQFPVGTTGGQSFSVYFYRQPRSI